MNFFDDLGSDKGGATILKLGDKLASGASKNICDPHLKHIYVKHMKMNKSSSTMEVLALLGLCTLLFFNKSVPLPPSFLKDGGDMSPRFAPDPFIFQFGYFLFGAQDA